MTSFSPTATERRTAGNLRTHLRVSSEELPELTMSRHCWPKTRIACSSSFADLNDEMRHRPWKLRLIRIFVLSCTRARRRGPNHDGGRFQHPCSLRPRCALLICSANFTEFARTVRLEGCQTVWSHVVVFGASTSLCTAVGIRSPVGTQRIPPRSHVSNLCPQRRQKMLQLLARPELLWADMSQKRLSQEAPHQPRSNRQLTRATSHQSARKLPRCLGSRCSRMRVTDPQIHTHSKTHVLDEVAAPAFQPRCVLKKRLCDVAVPGPRTQHTNVRRRVQDRPRDCPFDWRVCTQRIFNEKAPS